MCKHDQELAGLLFGFTALAMADLCYYASGYSQMIMGKVWSCGQWGIALLTVSLLTILMTLKACWFPTYGPDWSCSIGLVSH